MLYHTQPCPLSLSLCEHEGQWSTLGAVLQEQSTLNFEMGFLTETVAGLLGKGVDLNPRDLLVFSSDYKH